MAIYDNDGTTNYIIGKLYDNDGTTNNQIGKVYDNDGTTNHLIYSAEEQYFPGTTPSRYSPGGAGGYTANSTNWSCNVSNGTNVNSVTSCLKINMTGIKTITITGSSTLQGGVWLSNQSQFDSKQQQLYHPYYIFYSPDSSAYVQKANNISSVTWDVSSYSGNYYLFLGCFTNSNGDQSARVTSVIGIE